VQMTNREKVDGGFSFVDEDGQPLTDPALLDGWSADIVSSDTEKVEVLPYEANPDDKFNRTFVSKLNGTAHITATVTSPAGEAQVFEDDIEVKNSAFNKPVFTFSTPRPE